MATYHEGTRVEWTGAHGISRGFITDIYTDPVERLLQGAMVKRAATRANPAYLVRHDGGTLILLSHSDLRKA